MLGNEIDMFEVLCVLIIYARCELKRRLESKWQLLTAPIVIFELFCYNHESYMQKGEFKFMLNRLCGAISNSI